jgi:hypothetical protein
MAGWRLSWKADCGLRLLGLTLCGTAIAAVARLYGNLHDGTDHALGALDWGLATAAYLAGTAGAALTFSGRHLFDQVPIGPRYRAIDQHGLQPFSGEL